MGDSACAHEVRRRPYRPAAAAGGRDLRALPRFASGYVFTARGTRPLNDFGAVKRASTGALPSSTAASRSRAWTCTTAGGHSAPACRRSASPRILPNCVWRTGNPDWRGPTTCTASIRRSSRAQRLGRTAACYRRAAAWRQGGEHSERVRDEMSGPTPVVSAPGQKMHCPYRQVRTMHAKNNQPPAQRQDDNAISPWVSIIDAVRTCTAQRDALGSWRSAACTTPSSMTRFDPWSGIKSPANGCKIR